MASFFIHVQLIASLPHHKFRLKSVLTHFWDYLEVSISTSNCEKSIVSVSNRHVMFVYFYHGEV